MSFDRSRLMFEINVTNTKKDVTVNNGWITIMRDDYGKMRVAFTPGVNF